MLSEEYIICISGDGDAELIIKVHMNGVYVNMIENYGLRSFKTNDKFCK